jgi:hypothetical protein
VYLILSYVSVVIRNTKIPVKNYVYLILFYVAVVY